MQNLVALTLSFLLCTLLPMATASAALPNFETATTSADTIGDKSEAFVVPSVSNAILLVGCALDTITTTITGITYAGAALSLLDEVAGGSGTNTVSLWYKLTPATGSNTVAVDSSDNAQQVGCAYLVYSNVNQSSPYSGTTSQASTATSWSNNVTCPAGSLAIDLTITGDSETTLVASQTERVKATEVEAVMSWGMSEKAGEGTTAMEWTPATNTSFVHLLTCLAPAQTARPIAPIIFQ